MADWARRRSAVGAFEVDAAATSDSDVCERCCEEIFRRRRIRGSRRRWVGQRSAASRARSRSFGRRRSSRCPPNGQVSSTDRARRSSRAAAQTGCCFAPGDLVGEEHLEELLMGQLAGARVSAVRAGCRGQRPSFALCSNQRPRGRRRDNQLRFTRLLRPRV